MSNIVDFRYSKKDAAETGCGWYAVRHCEGLPDVSYLFATRAEAEGWARRADDKIVPASHRPWFRYSVPRDPLTRPVLILLGIVAFALMLAAGMGLLP